MYEKKFKQLIAAVLAASLVMGQAPVVRAASDNEEEFIFIDDSSELDLSETDDVEIEVSDETSKELSDEVSEEVSDDASDETSIEPSDTESNEEAAEITGEYELIEEVEDTQDLTVNSESESLSALPTGIAGMPEGYKLTSEEKKFKQELSGKEDVYEEFKTLEEGVDYISDEVICVTDSEEHAKEIAAAYSGELESYEYGVAVINLSGSTVDVSTAYSLAFEDGLNLPAVEPNYIYHLIGPTGSDADEVINRDAVAPDNESPCEEENNAEENAEFEATGSWSDIYKNTINGISFNDPFLDPADHYYQWHHDMIGTYEAWKITTGGSYNVTVAVIDSGVQSNHPELSGRVKTRSGDTTDDNGHGTHVAGIIAGAAGNGLGGSGIAPKANILAVKVLDKSGSAISSSAVLEGIRYVAAIKNDDSLGTPLADIANLSLGGASYNQALQDSINLAVINGVTIIAAMGNDRANHKVYPAGYDNVIAVGAVNETGERTSFSDYGSWQDIAAPGTDIVSSYPTSLTPSRYGTGSQKGYEVMDGTSQATPVVAGACALYMSYVGHVSPEAMQKALKSTSNKGILNVAKLLASAKPHAPLNYKNIVTGVQLNPSSENVGYKITRKNNSVSSATIYLGKALTNIAFSAKQSTSSGTAPAPYWSTSNPKVASIKANGSSVTVTAASKGKATITCAATDGSGKKASVTITVAQGVTDVQLSGPASNVTAGSKVTYKAAVYPKNANFKTVTYKLDKKYTDISINEKSGQVTLGKNAKGSFTVVAASTDPSGAHDEMTVTIGSKEKASLVTIAPPVTTTLASAAKGSLVNSVTLKAEAVTPSGTKVSDLIWKSSNDSVASLSKNRGGSVTLTAHKSGKVTITATANDGSKKKASVTFKVINPVASIHLVAKNGQSNRSIATGASITLNPVIGSTYGTPSNKKVNWTYEIYGLSGSTLKPLSAKAKQYCEENNALFRVDKKGKVTADEQGLFDYHKSELAKLGTNYEDYAVKVTATAADESGTYDTRILKIVNRNPYIKFVKYESSGIMYYYKSYGGYEGDSVFFLLDAEYYELAVENSNPAVADGYVTSLKLDGKTYSGLYINLKSKGSCKIKVKTMDGSGVSGTLPIKVYKYF
ncbi:S8 family serine peptidase [Butyrivibrio sp. AE3009]|uniref:S8 family serine peptidase n=1 Tax=Butyrivibrio sp. AE3009 TaxID=1280666 RepID=UPI0003B68327|nr:S8 family serine peptidase [Butyrivibrio sp. AE3009]